MKHGNVAVFIPHLGCPQQCSFCNQRSISGHQSAPSPAQVGALLQAAAGQAGRPDRSCEIAFFGGSFTAIDPRYREQLLDAAQPFLQSGAFTGIRISTRPDCLDESLCRHLKERGVTAIELGAQCMDDEVLAKNRRGHTAAQVKKASAAIKKAGLQLGLQMMTGLYGSSAQKDLQTAQSFCKIEPDTVRVYPTIVMAGTALCDLYRRGEYIPPTLEQVVEQVSQLLQLFYARHIPVIRVGLHRDEGLLSGMVAGPWHPAFRELCESRIYARALGRALKDVPPGRVAVAVHPSQISRLCGHGGQNRAFFAAQGWQLRPVPDPGVPPFTLKLVRT